MSMTEWARHEIELAIKFDGSDYGRSCYLSALKAYESLMADNHSGFSFGLTKNIFDRLTDSLPLTPINDIPEEWNDVSIEGEWPKRYQHKRRFSLFKHVEKDGSIDIFDMERWKCVESSNPERGLGSIRIVQRVMDDIYPIKFPYTPDPSKIVTINLLRDDDDNLTHVHIEGYRDSDYKQRIINKSLRYNKETGNWEELETDIRIPRKCKEPAIEDHVYRLRRLRSQKDQWSQGKHAHWLESPADHAKDRDALDAAIEALTGKQNVTVIKP